MNHNPLISIQHIAYFAQFYHPFITVLCTHSSPLPPESTKNPDLDQPQITYSVKY